MVASPNTYTFIAPLEESTVARRSRGLLAARGSVRPTEMGSELVRDTVVMLWARVESTERRLVQQRDVSPHRLRERLQIILAHRRSDVAPCEQHPASDQLSVVDGVVLEQGEHHPVRLPLELRPQNAR